MHLTCLECIRRQQFECPVSLHLRHVLHPPLEHFLNAVARRKPEKVLAARVTLAHAQVARRVDSHDGRSARQHNASQARVRAQRQAAVDATHASQPRGPAAVQEERHMRRCEVHVNQVSTRAVVAQHHWLKIRMAQARHALHKYVHTAAAHHVGIFRQELVQPFSDHRTPHTVQTPRTTVIDAMAVGKVRRNIQRTVRVHFCCCNCRCQRSCTCPNTRDPRKIEPFIQCCNCAGLQTKQARQVNSLWTPVAKEPLLLGCQLESSAHGDSMHHCNQRQARLPPEEDATSWKGQTWQLL
eukprot:6197742-Pleurochrysis_carterae.AAC.1